MREVFTVLSGETCSPENLAIHRARDFALLVQREVTPNAKFLASYRMEEGVEAVVVEVLPTVPQRPAQDIRRTEQVAVSFRPDDRWYPDVRALREDFPRERILHLNPGVPADEQPSLCLFAEGWQDVRLSLTPNVLLYRIQNWFDDTAAGKLHRPDQPLEPAFFAPPQPIILSPTILSEIASSSGGLPIDLDAVEGEAGRVIFQRRRDRFPQGSLFPGYALGFASAPHSHTVMNVSPRSFHDLNSMVRAVQIDLLSQVQTKLLSLQLTDQIDKYRFLLLFFALQRQREEGGAIEPELAAFMCFAQGENATLRQMLPQLGVGANGIDDRTGQDVPVVQLSIRYDLTPESARMLSGASELSPRLFAVGAGAIGSQVVANAVRTGLSDWFVVDSDYLLPHNLVRHELPGCWVGHPKSLALAAHLNTIYTEPTIDAVVHDITLDLPESAMEMWNQAEAIIDLSASIAVSRRLAVDLESEAPRCSIFASPSGRDMVFLGEDSARVFRLDSIESQYYRAVASMPELAGHLEGAEFHGSCRDITSIVSQELMGLHGVQGTRVLRRWLEGKGAAAIVARTSQESFDVSTVSVELGEPIRVGEMDGWTIFTDTVLLKELRAQREDNLPNETGGVLLAHFDTQRRNVYVCHQIPSPPDSLKQPTVYIRGSEGLTLEYERVKKATSNGLLYVGEWHSHPKGSACSPSKDDLLAGAWLAEETCPTSLPGLMLIVGDSEQTCWMLCQQRTEGDAPIHLTLRWGRDAG